MFVRFVSSSLSFIQPICSDQKMCDSSFIDYDSSTDEEYVPRTIGRLRTNLPKCNGINVKMPSLRNNDSNEGSTSTVHSSTTEKEVDPFDDRNEIIYENLVRPPPDTTILYGQLLRSTLSKLELKQQQKLVEELELLFGESLYMPPKKDSISTAANLVESKLRRMNERTPTEYRRTADLLCSILNKYKQAKLSRMSSIRKSFRKIMRK